MESPITVLLLRGHDRYWEEARSCLAAIGCRVEVFDGPLFRLEATISALQPDVIMVAADAMERDTLESICLFGTALPRPMVVFTEDPDVGKLRRAVRAGVAAYVVAGLAPERLLPILEAARVRHESLRNLHAELEATKQRLAGREAVDAAKRLLMQEGLSESEAHARLRRLAMDAGITKAEAARRLLQRSRRT
ncbi:MAG: ANTAR domain-containing protein [Burkholderiales bacterium]|jgi:response regulator NasT|nr:ANTAR domain-containing protein [Burkholderiales bacterium]